MPNFAQQFHLLVFMPFFIIVALAAIVGVVNLIISVRAARAARRLAPEMQMPNRSGASIKSAASWSVGAGRSGSAGNAQPAVRLVSSKL